MMIYSLVLTYYGEEEKRERFLFSTYNKEYIKDLSKRKSKVQDVIKVKSPNVLLPEGFVFSTDNIKSADSRQLEIVRGSNLTQNLNCYVENSLMGCIGCPFYTSKQSSSLSLQSHNIYRVSITIFFRHHGH